MNPLRSRRRRLHLEMLERRETPAIQVAVTGGIIKITGTDGIDKVVVDEIPIGGVVNYRVVENSDFSNAFTTPKSAVTKNSVSFDAKGGNDYFKNKSAHLKAEFHGGDGDDTCLGGGQGNKLFGDAGNDLLQSGVGNDILDGGAGDDSISAGAGIDKIFGGAGIDQIIAASPDDTVDSGPGDDRWIYGNVEIHRDDVLATSEVGGSTIITYRYVTPPKKSVTVTVQNSDTSEGKVFLSTALKRVTVKGVDDKLSDGDQKYTVRLNFASADPAYNFSAPIRFLVTNKDNEKPVPFADGKYTGKFSGRVSVAGLITNRAVSSNFAFTVLGNKVTLTNPAQGSLNFTRKNSTTIEFRPTAADLAKFGISLPFGVNVSNVVLTVVKPVVGDVYTWKLSGKASLLFTVRDIAGSGTWTATKVG